MSQLARNQLMNQLDGGYPKESINHKEHPDHNKPGFLVRATDRGYYGLAMREPGDVFRITHARHFADCNDPKNNGLGWMEKVENATQRQKRQAAQDAERGGRGAKPPPPDPAERDRRMATTDAMAEDAQQEDRDLKAEADVI